MEQCVCGPLEQVQAKEVHHQSYECRPQQKEFSQDAVPPERPLMNEAFADHFFPFPMRQQKSVNSAKVFGGIQQVNVAVWGRRTEAPKLFRPPAEQPDANRSRVKFLQRVC